MLSGKHIGEESRMRQRRQAAGFQPETLPAGLVPLAGGAAFKTVTQKDICP